MPHEHPDPIFYLHHAWLDKIYWDWQQKDLAVRLTEIGGTNLPNARVSALAGPPQFPASALLDFNGDGGSVTTLNHTLWMNGIAPNVTIGDVIDLNGGVNCAEYV